MNEWTHIILDEVHEREDDMDLHKTILYLKEMGSLLTTVGGLQSREDGDLTVMGEILAHLLLDVKLGKLIVLGHIFGILEESIVIASGLNGKSIFTAPFDRRVQAYKNKLFWADRTFSDCFAILLAYQTWDRKKTRGDFNMRSGGGDDREREFCSGSFLQKNQLNEMKMQVEEITKSLKMMDIAPLAIQDPVRWSEERKFIIMNEERKFIIMSQIHRCQAKARWFYNLHSSTLHILRQIFRNISHILRL